ncbi:unnamed protein product [Pleuronectes platessa]|uniref:Uncharacterized protein n=1 Tax=Pleuronectes platessa TaxID=8262 RepID=A0A9N7W4I3_PLEPL|nr:unnamed protein product [Pleuronectes platessa]
MLEPEHVLLMQVNTKCCVCVVSCLLLACVYVGSLYVWKSNLPRDHPTVIKRRCASVLLVAALSPVAVKAWTHWAEIRDTSQRGLNPEHVQVKSRVLTLRGTLAKHKKFCEVNVSVWELMGLRMEGFIPAVTLPLLLTVVSLH